MKTTYVVANNNGDLAGHDLDFATAEQVLNAILAEDPDNIDEWDIIEQQRKKENWLQKLLNY